jgi:3-hydroxyisobutyrate dehydrogenase-like beta-hydroxyacid dehydrogenase
MKIGFIGLGIMGSRMAANLQKHGCELVVYNRSQEKASDLLRNGAAWADSPAAVAGQVQILFTMLSTPDAVRQVAAGPSGFFDHLKPGSLWVDTSTVNPSFSREVAEEAHRRNLRFVDAPVAGSRGPAEKGQLLFMVGGSAEDVEEIRSLLGYMGQKVIHAGEIGMGTSLKLVFNHLLAMSMISFAEGLILGESLGLSREMLLDALQGSVIVAPSALGKRSKIEAGDYSPDFPLQWMQKDLQLVSISAYENNTALPLANLAKELYMLAVQAGLAEADFSAIYKLFHEMKDGK